LKVREILRNAENRAMGSDWLQYAHEERRWAEERRWVIILCGLNIDIYCTGRNCENVRNWGGYMPVFGQLLKSAQCDLEFGYRL
jgi:hypothetical protein